MTVTSLLHVERLVTDLGLAVDYASRAGLLREKHVLETLKSAEHTLRDDRAPDIYAITTALNDLAQLIAPITLADLTAGRNPFLPQNQRASRFLQLGLTIFSLLVLVTIGHFMQALRLEQAAISDLNQIQELQPQLKLTALRKIAQYDDPMVKQSTVYDDFHRRITELRQINSRLYVTYTDALVASNLPLLPFGNLFTSLSTSGVPAPMPNPVPTTPATKDVGGIPPSDAASQPVGARRSKIANKEAQPGPIRPDASTTTSETSTSLAEVGSAASQIPPKDGFCVAEPDGTIKVPSEALAYPEWLKRALSDTLGDFCFQVNVLSREGDSALLTQALNQLTFVSQIKDKVALRATWFLPFLFGLLGSTVYLMRQVASVRTPTMEWFPVIMRVSLGGVAGIVIGWFAFATGPKLESTTSLSVPFALAFLTGYGIDVLFTVLDRLSRAIETVSSTRERP